MRRGTVRSIAVRAALAAFVGVVLVQGCRSDSKKPIEPVLRGAVSAAPKSVLDVSGSGSTAAGTVTSNRGGIDCIISASGGASGKCSQRFKTGTVITLTAAPASGATLSYWVGCTQVTDSPLSCEVTMDQSRSVVAVFAPPASSFPLTVSGGAGGSGKVTSTPQGIDCTITNGSAASTGCRATFAAGQGVKLTATAAAGSYLKAWAGAGCETAGTGIGGSSGSCALTLSQAQSVVVSFDVNATVSSLGRWDAPIPWPAVAIHAHLLPDGRVMTYGRHVHQPVLWTPATGAFASTVLPVDLFCSGHTFLPDGRLLVTGGHSGTDNQGILATEIFDYRTNSWTAGPDMHNGRWYPTNTTLASGEILTVSGGDTAQQRNLIPEVYQANGTWRALSTASLFLPYYPFMYVAPDGRVFAGGPSKSTYYLDPTGTGKWTAGPSSNFGDRGYGSSVMYAPGKILIVGGGTPTRTAEVIDLNAGAAAAWRYVASMSVARRQTTATLLADGRVLVTGGTNSSGFNVAPTTDKVLAAELWDPSTEQWSTLARMTHYRLYHSTALLLPDGRVLSVGSGQPAATGLSDDYTAEIYYPPYLFNPDGTLTTRPTITSAPSRVSYGQAFTVQTPNAAAVSKVTWIRLGSVTHAFNQSQRMNRLSFSVSGTTALAVSAPGSATLSPPGFYLLFLVDSRGVPSVAAIVQIT